MSKKQKQMLYRIGGAAALFIPGMILEHSGIGMALLLAAYALIGWDILWRAAVNIRHGRVFDENFLMSIATIGAILLGDYSEGVAVMLLYQIGEWFQAYAVQRSRRSISSLMDIRPDTARVLRGGEEEEVFPDEVEVGDTILVRPGERVPLDGIIRKGEGLLDTSALTGESMPREAHEGDEIISGCINQTGVLEIEVTTPYEESTVERILSLVEEATDKKATTEAFITRFARWYTPAVVIGALLLAIVPPLVTGDPFAGWIYRALTFLVISCPCALVISVPLSFFAGIGGASRAGILIKGGNYLEALAKADTVVFDKTGTLTKGSFSVTDVLPANGFSKDEVLFYAANAERYSTHPIGVSIVRAFTSGGHSTEGTDVHALEEKAGRGISAHINGRIILLGTVDFLKAKNTKDMPAIPHVGAVCLAINGRYAGVVHIADEVKDDAKVAVSALKERGIGETVMLTGDSKWIGTSVGKSLGIDTIHAELLPQDKVAQVEERLAGRKEGATLAYVGDGINDAPVLARADVGIAMGALGSDAAIEAADVVLMTDEPKKIATAIDIARKTMRIAWQNIIFAIGIKGIVLVLGALGMAGLWAAIFADVGVTVLAILNAMRALHVKE
ncbi:cadmium-exporting ATPase [Selenomonas sp. oral taxon 137 str. F0430]|uniref:heavy metal translocating P-type ATPase n=1 Tax=Selenomonas sp. oral taxon 137 TaxID=712531 RepID=UPI0001EB20EF|nr:heavy metal translocating P-type ATPase [Selenomonas sp. oral taxon 137]EFR39953.1 cadmium-exporting ATPase [Selenomonas sp. oral taxon 137 str. F0430]